MGQQLVLQGLVQGLELGIEFPGFRFAQPGLRTAVARPLRRDPRQCWPRHRRRASIFVMIDWSTCAAVERNPDRVSGVWVFRGTRVPVTALFVNLEDGAPVSQFVEWFPGVSLDQVRAVLEHAARSALTPV